ncbi:hypothetical protein RSAG8_08821, partial [Rhizoctonia solani AG-8 WAC10335]
MDYFLEPRTRTRRASPSTRLSFSEQQQNATFGILFFVLPTPAKANGPRIIATCRNIADPSPTEDEDANGEDDEQIEPEVVESDADDLLSEERSLLGILTSRPDELIIYSLRTHTILKRLPFNSPQAIQASDQFIVASTVAPPVLHILNSVTFDPLSMISAPHIALPIFALSRRVLAYTSAPPPPSTSPILTSPSKVQADISMAIEGGRKVGVGVRSGVRSLLGEGNAPRAQPTYPPAVRSPTPMSPPMLGSPRMYSCSDPSEVSYSTGSPLPCVTVSATGEP